MHRIFAMLILALLTVPTVRGEAIDSLVIGDDRGCTQGNSTLKAA